MVIFLPRFWVILESARPTGQAADFYSNYRLLGATTSYNVIIAAFAPSVKWVCAMLSLKKQKTPPDAAGSSPQREYAAAYALCR
jgi:hypothetical protein